MALRILEFQFDEGNERETDSCFGGPLARGIVHCVHPRLVDIGDE